MEALGESRANIYWSKSTFPHPSTGDSFLLWLRQLILPTTQIAVNDYNLTENELHEVYKNVVILSDGPPPAEPNSTWEDIKSQVLKKKPAKMCPPYCNTTVSEASFSLLV